MTFQTKMPPDNVLVDASVGWTHAVLPRRKSKFLNTLYTEHDTVAVTARLRPGGLCLKSRPASGHHEVISMPSYSLKLNGGMS